MDCLTAALRYAKRGWRVFPLNGKHPYKGTHGHNDATTDTHVIRSWWKKWPNANVGVACDSASGPIIVDIDGPKAAELIDAMALPETRMSNSRGIDNPRRHLWFDPPLDGTRVKRVLKIRPQLDILGDGGYVVAPPSVHPDYGTTYAWLNRKTALAAFPKELLQLTSERRTIAAPRLPETLDEGSRDELLTSLAGSMRRRGASQESILAALREENASRCNPPLADHQLRKIAKSIATKDPAPKTEHRTDLGNARRFITQHQLDIRAVASQRRPWVIWDGQRWMPDNTGEAERRAKQTVRSLYAEAAMLPDEEQRDEMLKHASRSESAKSIRAMLELAATEPEITLAVNELDANDWLLNVENGTIDLRTGKLKKHRRSHYITKLVPIEYNPAAEAPRWEQFVEEIMCGDAELVRYFQTAIGYTLTGDTREQCLFFLYGKGSNGKSTAMEIVRLLTGSYGIQADFRTFLARRVDGGGPRDDLARMNGARFVSASEASGDVAFDTTTIKQLTGDDTVTARHLYERTFEFKPKHKLWLAANHKPIVKEMTTGFWRRVRLIPFVATFTEQQRDKLLMHTLQAELPGILNWALDGCRAWQRYGLKEPRAVRKATKMYQEENDLLGEFIEAHCELVRNAWTPTNGLYAAFSDWWMETRGPRAAPVSLGWFSRLLSERPELHQSKEGGMRGWRGIALRVKLPN